MKSTMTLSEMINKYKFEFETDCKLSEMNLRERQLALPAIKHKYVAYLIQHKQQRYELEQAKKKAIAELISQSNIEVGLSRPATERKHENNPTIKKINNMITEQDIIIEYLEKIETITKSMTYDLGNLIKIMGMEMT